MLLELLRTRGDKQCCTVEPNFELKLFFLLKSVKTINKYLHIQATSVLFLKNNKRNIKSLNTTYKKKGNKKPLKHAVLSFF